MVKIHNSKGVFINVNNIEVEGIIPNELSEDTKKLLVIDPQDIIYFKTD